MIEMVIDIIGGVAELWFESLIEKIRRKKNAGTEAA